MKLPKKIKNKKLKKTESMIAEDVNFLKNVYLILISRFSLRKTSKR
jgi:hypothetical protein